MALSSEQIEILADKYIQGLYGNMEQEVIGDIARRVKKTMRYTETAELQAKFMREQGYSTSEIQSKVMRMLRADKDFQREVAENTKAYKQEVKELIKQTVAEAEAAGDMMVAQAGDMAWNDDLQMWSAHNVDLKKPNNLSQLMQAFTDQTKGELRNITRSSGFKGVNTAPVSIMNAYQREVDLATLEVASGTFSYDTAVEKCVHRLAASGLRSIDYASGRTYELDTAARMSTRTACSQLAGKITERNIQRTGVDLVYVDAHAGARPEHAEWQGQVYSYSGKSKKYDNFASATDYGDVNGLKGVNCSHNFFPYWEGDVIPEFTEPDKVSINGKEFTRYEANQEQRRMERGIRATKREIEASQAAGLEKHAEELQAKLRAQRQEYISFSNKAGIKVKENRLAIIKGTSRSMNIKSSGAISGALNDLNDPLGIKRSKHAKSYYAEIKNRNRENVLSKLSKNSGMSKKAVEKVYNHVFIEKHFLEGRYKNFDPDYTMSESFRRLLEGTDVKDHDVLLLKHEKLEADLMKRYNMTYQEAHDLTNTKYNYSDAASRFEKELLNVKNSKNKK